MYHFFMRDVSSNTSPCALLPKAFANGKSTDSIISSSEGETCVIASGASHLMTATAAGVNDFRPYKDEVGTASGEADTLQTLCKVGEPIKSAGRPETLRLENVAFALDLLYQRSSLAMVSSSRHTFREAIRASQSMEECQFTGT